MVVGASSSALSLVSWLLLGLISVYTLADVWWFAPVGSNVVVPYLLHFLNINNRFYIHIMLFKI